MCDLDSDKQYQVRARHNIQLNTSSDMNTLVIDHASKKGIEEEYQNAEISNYMKRLLQS